MTPVWDVAVIGGGPAGCSAAIRLAEQGMRVILLEAKTYPHDKMCGEFLSPECHGLLAGLGMTERVQRRNPVTITHTRLTAPDGALWEAPLPGQAIGISRRVLDAALAERAEEAGVQVCQGITVRAVTGDFANGFALEAAGRSGTVEPLRARTVIAAHGKRAGLDRALNRRFLAQKQPFVAVKAHFRGPAIPGRVELHTFPGGYCGLSEIEEDARVVCFLAEERVFQPRSGVAHGGVDAFVAWMAGQNPRLGAWLKEAERIHPRWISIAQVPFVDKPAMEGDVLMAGDSAGLIVPLAGNGISMALEGGLLAADQLGRWLSGDLPAEDLRREYPAAWRARFGGRLRLGRMLQPLMLRPKSAGLALRLLNRLPALGAALVAGTRGKMEDVPVGKITRSV